MAPSPCGSRVATASRGLRTSGRRRDRVSAGSHAAAAAGLRVRTGLRVRPQPQRDRVGGEASTAANGQATCAPRNRGLRVFTARIGGSSGSTMHPAARAFGSARWVAAHGQRSGRHTWRGTSVPRHSQRGVFGLRGVVAPATPSGGRRGEVRAANAGTLQRARRVRWVKMYARLRPSGRSTRASASAPRKVWPTRPLRQAAPVEPNARRQRFARQLLRGTNVGRSPVFLRAAFEAGRRRNVDGSHERDGNM